MFLLGGLGRERLKGGRGVGPVERKREKQVVRGEGWGQEQEPPKVRASYCCNPPLNKQPLSLDFALPEN